MESVAWATQDQPHAGPGSIQDLANDDTQPGPSGTQEIKIARSFEDLCEGVSNALQPMMVQSIAKALRDSQPVANPPNPPPKRARLDAEPQLSDDEEDFPEGQATEDISQAGPVQNKADAGDSLPDDAALLQLSKNLQAYLALTLATTPAQASGGTPDASSAPQLPHH